MLFRVISRDSRQKWLFLADGRNNLVLTLDRRTGEVVNTLGRSGRYGGEFQWFMTLTSTLKAISLPVKSTTASVQKFSRNQ